MNPLTFLTQGFTDLFFPKVCQRCGERFEEGLSNILCRACFDAGSFYEEPVCDHCGVSLAPGAFGDAVLLRCSDCGDKNYYLDKVRALGPYEGALRIAHHGFKFEGMENLKGPLTLKMLSIFAQDLWKGIEVLVPVPLSADRERERGYNPATLLAGEISRAIQIPLSPLLRKIKSTRPQMSLTREERLKNPMGTYEFQLRGPVPSKVIVVDDVFTTGATLEECARVLKKGGVRWVGAIVIGRTHRYF